MEPQVKNGLYRHYNNGKVYRLLHESINKDTEKADIVYREFRKRQVYSQGQDKENFFATLVINGKSVPQFKYLEGKAKPENLKTTIFYNF